MKGLTIKRRSWLPWTTSRMRLKRRNSIRLVSGRPGLTRLRRINLLRSSKRKSRRRILVLTEALG
jgi:hypothetical protein